MSIQIDLGENIVPPGISGYDHARLNEVFNQLDSKIDHLSRKIEQRRVYDQRGANSTSKISQKCQMICREVKDGKLECLQQCMQPVVPLEELRGEFPIDMQRLDRDMELRQNFERHQHSPNQIKPTMDEASVIADIYAMPISTAALPEESWRASMDVITLPEFEAQKIALVNNWKIRQGSYSDQAKDELARKVQRHDSGENLLTTATYMSR